MIIYALIARGSLVLAEYTPHDGDFASVARQILIKSPRTQQKKTFSKEDYAFVFFSADEFTFMCLTKTCDPKETSFKFLDELSELFFSKHVKNEGDKGTSWSAQLSVLIKQLIVKAGM